MPLTPEKVAQCDARMFAIIHEDIGKRLAEYYAAAVFFNDDKHPAQVNNEIRNALNHLTRARHESDSWSAAEENFKAAMRHVERAQRDCLKLAIIGLFGQLTETFRGIEYYYGAVQPAFSVRKTELIKRRKEAYLKESKGEETIVNILVGKYNSTEIYDFKTGIFTRIADMNGERFKLADAAVLLGDGNVLIGGGNQQIEIFDAKNQIFILGDKLDDDYFYSVLTLLQNNQVLITGGYNPNIQPSDKAWLYCN